jgi:hypothetical protein
VVGPISRAHVATREALTLFFPACYVGHY